MILCNYSDQILTTALGKPRSYSLKYHLISLPIICFMAILYNRILPCHIAWLDCSEHHLDDWLLAVVCKLSYHICELCPVYLTLPYQSWQCKGSPLLYASLPLPPLKGRQCIMCSLKLRLKLHGKKKYNRSSCHIFNKIWWLRIWNLRTCIRDPLHRALV